MGDQWRDCRSSHWQWSSSRRRSVSQARHEREHGDVGRLEHVEGNQDCRWSSWRRRSEQQDAWWESSSGEKTVVDDQQRRWESASDSSTRISSTRWTEADLVAHKCDWEWAVEHLLVSSGPSGKSCCSTNAGDGAGLGGGSAVVGQEKGNAGAGPDGAVADPWSSYARRSDKTASHGERDRNDVDVDSKSWDGWLPVSAEASAAKAATIARAERDAPAICISAPAWKDDGRQADRIKELEMRVAELEGRIQQQGAASAAKSEDSPMSKVPAALPALVTSPALPPPRWGDPRFFRKRAEWDSWWCVLCGRYADAVHVKSDRHVKRARLPEIYLPMGEWFVNCVRDGHDADSAEQTQWNSAWWESLPSYDRATEWRTGWECAAKAPSQPNDWEYAAARRVNAWSEANSDEQTTAGVEWRSAKVDQTASTSFSADAGATNSHAVSASRPHSGPRDDAWTRQVSCAVAGACIAEKFAAPATSKSLLRQKSESKTTEEKTHKTNLTVEEHEVKEQATEGVREACAADTRTTASKGTNQVCAATERPSVSCDSSGDGCSTAIAARQPTPPSFATSAGVEGPALASLQKPETNWKRFQDETSRAYWWWNEATEEHFFEMGAADGWEMYKDPASGRKWWHNTASKRFFLVP
eukprot:TRINITY_DN9498_c0_g1_i3.p1 TRINITY_DN9498_c0_g1~~TRINITY_DN9498_c0_g1_i3.p1  ORF type:complete len:688 (+),score=112.00 TRINITY_DN9498_c0_g1_i3:136-2064(+)